MPSGEPVGRIVLVGFMASGKSTVGRELADLLGWRFIDFDEEIERRTGMAIPDLFRLHGEPAFRSLEAGLTSEVAHLDRIVLAPGGGWITQPELLDLFDNGTLVVWLRISPAEAVRRARRTLSHRPLLAGADPMARAHALIREREPLYRLADVVIDVDARSAGDIAREIVEIVQSDWEDPIPSDGGEW